MRTAMSTVTAIEHLPPHNLEAEQSMLGSLMIDRDAIIRVASSVKPDDFYSAANGDIYAAIVDLYNRREPTDLVTLSAELDRRNRLELVGGISYLSSLLTVVPTSVHVEFYSKIVERTATLRRLIHAGTEIVRIGYDDATEVDDAIDQAERTLFEVSQRRATPDFESVGQILDDYFTELDMIRHNRGDLVGVPTGYTELDRLLGGLQRSDLVILAARPAVGKSSFALGIAHSAAMHHRRHVGIFSLEMSSTQLVLRLLSVESGVDIHKIRLGDMNDDQWLKVTQTFGKLGDVPIYIDDSAGLSVMDVRSKARRLQAEHGLDLLIIDYLQLMHGRRTENRVQEISEISRGLKELARELNIPVLALSQLSRAVESRSDRRPLLSDLRESGSIEQDADIVMFIYRDEIYNKDSAQPGVAEIILAKHRNGPTGSVNLGFFGSHAKFSDLPHYREPPAG